TRASRHARHSGLHFARVEGELGTNVSTEIDHAHLRRQLDQVRQTLQSRRRLGRRIAWDLIELADWLLDLQVARQTHANATAGRPGPAGGMAQDCVSPKAQAILLNPDGRGEVF